MRRLSKFIVPLIFLPLIMGMGSIFGKAPSGKIPKPEKKFTVTFIDQMDVTAKCTEVSIEGETLLEGTHGKGLYTVSFDNIENIVFYLKNGEFTGNARLRDGSTVSLALNKDAIAYGRTKYGTFQIKLSDLKKVIITPTPDEKK